MSIFLKVRHGVHHSFVWLMGLEYLVQNHRVSITLGCGEGGPSK